MEVCLLDANKKFSEDEQALIDFVLDIGCLDSLSDWTSKINLFDILKVSRTEIRHSNLLSWLLNPNDNHGFGDKIIQGFIQYVATSFNADVDVFDTLLMDCHDFTIRREWKHIDILAVSTEKKFVLCIENKIDSIEHDNQLRRYRSIIDETYPAFKIMYLFVSPDGSESSDPEYWCPMGYHDVLDIVENARTKVKLLPDVALLIDNYVEMLRRNIVGDERLGRICAEIYAKHQKALDLIFENKPDRASDIAGIFRQWAIEKTEKGEIDIVLDKCNKKYTRFMTKTMSEILPDAEEALSGWKTKNYYFYEITTNEEGAEFFIQLAISSMYIPNHLKVMCERINALYSSRRQKEWRLHFSTKSTKIGEEIAEEKIYDQLDKKLDEVKAFEQRLKAQLEQAQ